MAGNTNVQRADPQNSGPADVVAGTAGNHNGPQMPFDYAGWGETADDFNFLADSAVNLHMDSGPSSHSTTPYNAERQQNGPSAFSPMEQNPAGLQQQQLPQPQHQPQHQQQHQQQHQPQGPQQGPQQGSPGDYAMQLQQYQNLLLETQNIMNMKQQAQAQLQAQVQAQQAQQKRLDEGGSRRGSAGANAAGNGAAAKNTGRSPAAFQQAVQAFADTPPFGPQQQHQQQFNGTGAPMMGPAVGPGGMPAFPSPVPPGVPMMGMNPQALQQAYGGQFMPQQPQGAAPAGQQAAMNAADRKAMDPPQPRIKVRPCDHCRRRKIRCVMIPEINSCRMCQTKGLKCTFKTLKRGLAGDQSDPKRMHIEDPTIQPPPNIPVRDVHPIRDYSKMSGRSLLKKTLSLQYPRSSFYVGPTSIYDPIFLERITLDKIDQFQLSKTNSIRKVADKVQFTLRDDFSEALYEKSEKDADTVERYVAPHGQALIDLYFRTVHPSFPVLHKKIFLEKYSRTHREFGAPLLAAVYLLAIQWWDYDPNLSQYPKPNVESLHRFALRSFAEFIHRPKLSAVQAGLLLLQCRTPEDNDKNWLLCCQVVALAEELGLGLECANWRLPRWERGLRRRLAWSVYVQDKWSSLIEARPSHIHEGRNWLVHKVTNDDFPEKSNDDDQLKDGSADVQNGKKSFKQMVALSEILGEILDTFYSAVAMQDITSIEKVLTFAKPLQLKLRNWYHSLPRELQMNSLKPRHFNSNGSLQLAYFATEITLHRRIITALHQQTESAPPPELVRVCRNAAKTRLTASIEFARELKAEHMQAFWHSSAVNNFALIGMFAALLYVTSSTPEEAAGYKEQLFDYRWVLKVNSRSFDIASRALSKIDGLLKSISGLLNDYNIASGVGSTGDISTNGLPSASSLAHTPQGTSSSAANGSASSDSSLHPANIKVKLESSEVDKLPQKTSAAGTPQTMNTPGSQPGSQPAHSPQLARASAKSSPVRIRHNSTASSGSANNAPLSSPADKKDN